jgi:hypothetical protein
LGVVPSKYEFGGDTNIKFIVTIKSVISENAKEVTCCNFTDVLESLLIIISTD